MSPGLADEPEPLDNPPSPIERAQQLDERMAEIDRTVDQLNQQRTDNRNAMRELHLQRFQTRQQLQTENEEIAALQQAVADAEVKLHDLKLELNRMLAEQPAYQEASEAQQAMIAREGEIAREVSALSEEKVALQIERRRIQAEIDEEAKPAGEIETTTEQELETP
jgi:chromosome segregation ATPase